MGHLIEISQHSLRSHPLCLLVLLNLSVSDKDAIIREAVMREKCSFFLILFKRPLTPPPLLSFEHHVVIFSEGILTKVRKRLSQQLSTK